MTRGKIKLIRKQEPGLLSSAAGGNPERESGDESRKRIRALLEQLNSVNTKAEIQEAMARGLPFNHGAFAKFCKVGTDTLRKKNDDLYEKLKNRLVHLEKIAGRPLRGRRLEPRGPTSGKGNSGKKPERMVPEEIRALREELSRERALRRKGEEEILRLAGLLTKARQTATA